jgi:hypothetical protein
MFSRARRICWQKLTSSVCKHALTMQTIRLSLFRIVFHIYDCVSPVCGEKEKEKERKKQNQNRAGCVCGICEAGGQRLGKRSGD